MRGSRIGHGTRIALCAAMWLVTLPGFHSSAVEPLIAVGQFDHLYSRTVAPAGDPIVRLPSKQPAAGDIRSRSQLTGSWCGARDNLAAKGVTFFADMTQYYQGVTRGGLEQRFAYGGRGDYLLDFDSQKMGLWEGTHLDLRGETRLGQGVNEFDAALALTNFAMALPILNGNVTALTGVQITQQLSDNLSVFAGKLNLLDGTPERYAQGRRLRYFWNAALQTNITRAYLLPSVLGCGLTVRDEGEPIFNFYCLDTHYTPTTSGFPTLFSNGVVLYSEYSLRTQWFDQPGHSAVGFLYSDAARTALDTNPYFLLAAILAGLPVPTEHSAWTATYRFDQTLFADPREPKHDWTLNGDFGISDGNPNPVRWFANVSLVGNGLIRSRENDTFGIGYYHLGLSSVPLFTLHHIGDENGVECFYNAAVRPWFHVTPDFQVITPAQHLAATAILVGIRAQITF